MDRREAVAAVVEVLTEERIVFANGFVSRDAFAAGDSDRHLYMLGSMGLAAVIGLGVALARPDARVAVVDGDGNLLMGMGVLPMVGAWAPANLLHLVLDNGTYGSTGAQPTLARSVDLPAIALACGYRRATSVTSAADLRDLLAHWRPLVGPSLVHAPIAAEEPRPSGRVTVQPEDLAARFAATFAAAR